MARRDFLDLNRVSPRREGRRFRDTLDQPIEPPPEPPQREPGGLLGFLRGLLGEPANVATDVVTPTRPVAPLPSPDIPGGTRRVLSPEELDILGLEQGVREPPKVPEEGISGAIAEVVTRPIFNIKGVGVSATDIVGVGAILYGGYAVATGSWQTLLQRALTKQVDTLLQKQPNVNLNVFNRHALVQALMKGFQTNARTGQGPTKAFDPSRINQVKIVIDNLFKRTPKGSFTPQADKTANDVASAIVKQYTGQLAQITPQAQPSSIANIISSIEGNLPATVSAVQGVRGELEPTVESITSKIINRQELTQTEEQFRVNNAQLVEDALKTKAPPVPPTVSPAVTPTQPTTPVVPEITPPTTVTPEVVPKVPFGQTPTIQRVTPLPTKAVTPNQGRIDEINKLIATEGRLPKGQGTKPELKVELARLDAQDEVATFTRIEDFDQTLDDVITEAGNRSLPFHGRAGNLFPQYDTKQLSEFSRVIQEAKGQFTPPTEVSITAPIAVQTGLPGLERPAQARAFEEFGGAPGTGGVRQPLIDAEVISAQQAAQPLPGQIGLPTTEVPPVLPTARVESIQQQGTVAPRTVSPTDARYSHTEKAAPDGPRPPGPPPPVGKAQPEKSPDEILRELVDNQLEGKRLDETVMRLYGGASRRVKTQTAATVEEVSNELHALGIGVKKRGFIVPKEKDKSILDELYNALHNPSLVASGEIAIPQGFEAVYNELRGLADWDTASRLDADPNAMTLEDWFFRGWKPPEGMFPSGGKGRLGTEPAALRKPRVGATYQEMRELGFEPLFWNPAQQWGYRHNLGELYREQMVLVDQLKSLDENLIMPVVGGSLPAGWRVPEIGPAFEGKPFATIDADGNPAVMLARRWAVQNKTANLLESMFGKRLDLGTMNVFGRDIDPLTVIDWISFVPKRAKLFGSYFQHIDFLTRAGGNSWAKVLDSLAAGKPIDAAIASVRFPKDAFDILKANFNPATRLSLAKQWEDTTPLLEGRPGVHLQGIFKAGISVMDETIFARDMDKLMSLVANNTGVWNKFKGVGSSLVDLESSMRRALFGGTYPAAMMTSIKNDFATMMARQHPTATDAQLNGYIAEATNLRYSTLPVEQSILQNRVIREAVRRIAFSWGESEALIRQATRMFHGSEKKFWIKNFAGTLLFLAVVAEIVHAASTGEPLPKERFVPISKNKWGPLPFGYNNKFLSPTLPWQGRGGTEMTVDLMGQMDTVFRLLNPAFFLTARVSVPIRAAANQVSGADFYGAPVEGLGERAGLLATDLFAPIGAGGLGIEALRQNIPGAEGVIPEGESRLGLTGLALQATGANIRSEGTRELLDRKARESGFLKRDGTPVQDWSELEPRQKNELTKDKALIAELALRQETSVAREAEGAAGFEERNLLEEERVTRGEALVNEFEQGIYPETGEFPREFTKLKADIASRKSQVNDDFLLFQDTQELPEDPNKRALAEYYTIYDNAQRESKTIDWEKVERLEAELRESWTAEQESFVDDNVGLTEWGPKMQEFVDAQETLTDSGYWDIEEPNQFNKRKSLRLNMPEIDAILIKWYGYKSAEPRMIRPDTPFPTPTPQRIPGGRLFESPGDTESQFQPQRQPGDRLRESSLAR